MFPAVTQGTSLIIRYSYA